MAQETQTLMIQLVILLHSAQTHKGHQPEYLLAFFQHLGQAWTLRAPKDQQHSKYLLSRRCKKHIKNEGECIPALASQSTWSVQCLVFCLLRSAPCTNKTAWPLPPASTWRVPALVSNLYICEGEVAILRSVSESGES